jgi:hypothetical protein
VRTPIAIRGHGATVERDAALGCAGSDPFRLFEVDDGGYISLGNRACAHNVRLLIEKGTSGALTG